MKKTVKIIAALLGLLLLALLIIPLLFNLNDYKGEIERLAKEASGRELQINGEIELSLFPWLGVTIGEVTLGSAPGFDERFASIERAEVKLRLIPLLSRRLEAGVVVLRGLRLDLSVAEDGTTNWEDLAAGQAVSTGQDAGGQGENGVPDALESTSPDIDPNTDGGVSLAALAIGGLQIEDAEVSYIDHTNNSRYAVKELSLRSGSLSLEAPLEVALSTQFEASQAELSKFRGQLELQTRIRFDLANERYHFTESTLEVMLKGAELPGGEATLGFSADIDLDLQQQTITLSPLELKGYGLVLSGEFNAQQILSDALAFNSDLRIAEFNPRSVMQTLAMELPETADTAALSRVQLSFAVDGTLDQYKLQRLELILDESRIGGELQLVMLDAPLPAVKYALSIDQIDLDRYLPPSAEASDAAVVAAPIATPASAGAAAATLPLETLRALDLNGTLEIGKLKLSGLQLSEIKTTVAARAGVIRLQPLSATLYQGQYQGDLTLDVRADQPKISLNESLQQIHVGPLLKDYMGEEKIRGVGSVTAKLTANGATSDAISSSLNGTAAIAFVDGAIKDLNLVQMVREAEAQIKGQSPPPTSAELRETDFAELKASFDITNGLVKNSDLSIKSPFLRVAGAGQADLVDESIDYLAKAVISKTEQGQGGAELDALRGLTLPVRIRGTFDNPTFKLELGDLLEAEAKKALAKEKAELKAKFEQRKAEEQAELQQKLEAEKRRLKEAAEKKLKDKLKEQFGR